MKRKYAVYAQVIQTDDTMSYRAKVIESEVPPPNMAYDHLARLFAQEGRSMFTWVMHPDSHELAQDAINDIRARMAKESITEPYYLMEVDTRNRSVRQLMSA